MFQTVKGERLKAKKGKSKKKKKKCRQYAARKDRVSPQSDSTFLYP